MQNIPEQHLARVTARGRISGPVALPLALRNPDVSLGEIWLKIWKRRVAASLFASGIFLAVILYTF
jgi:hypothetical protein